MPWKEASSEISVTHFLLAEYWMNAEMMSGPEDFIEGLKSQCQRCLLLLISKATLNSSIVNEARFDTKRSPSLLIKHFTQSCLRLIALVLTSAWATADSFLWINDQLWGALSEEALLMSCSTRYCCEKPLWDSVCVSVWVCVWKRERNF